VRASQAPATRGPGAVSWPSTPNAVLVRNLFELYDCGEHAIENLATCARQSGLRVGTARRQSGRPRVFLPPHVR
jgi:hypothetical protein